jgi:hypothetical protein
MAVDDLAGSYTSIPTTMIRLGHLLDLIGRSDDVVHGLTKQLDALKPDSFIKNQLFHDWFQVLWDRTAHKKGVRYRRTGTISQGGSTNHDMGDF